MHRGRGKEAGDPPQPMALHSCNMHSWIQISNCSLSFELPLCLPIVFKSVFSKVFREQGLIYMVLEYGDIDLARLLYNHEEVWMVWMLGMMSLLLRPL
jgi:hypothetical protein